MDKPKVAIVISTYNGEKYIKEQIESILNQTYKNIEIYVRDDGSKDNTVQILKEYETKGKIKLIVGKNLGFINSFFETLTYCNDAKYYAFSDQDDIWEANKIEIGVEILEKENNEIPIMYYSNYDYYDTDMNFKSNSQERKNTSFQNCLVECVNPGMTTIINNNLRNLIINNLPKYCEGHDWWAYMLAQTFGKVIYDNRITNKHRVHEKNVSMCGKNFIQTQIHRITSLKKHNYFETIKKQIGELKRYFYKDLSKEQQKIIDSFEKITLKNQLRKLFYLHRYRNLITDEILIRIMFLIGAI